MKRLALLGIVGLFITGCVEEGPLIILEEPVGVVFDTTYVTTTIPSAQLKGVLMEEFSGVKCSNCPEGNLATNSLVSTHGERLIAVTAHSNFLGSPYEGNPDLRTEDANALSDALGPINGKPSTFIDRKFFPGLNTREIIEPNSWGSYVSQQLSLSTPVNIELEQLDYNASSRILSFRVTLTYTAAASDHNLGIGFTESEIIAQQLDGSTLIPDYEHEYILRDYTTSIIGDPLTQPLTPGRVYVTEYALELNEDWVINHMELVAFIRGANDEIVHAAKLALN